MIEKMKASKERAGQKKAEDKPVDEDDIAAMLGRSIWIYAFKE